MACIEAARSLAGIEGASSTEFGETSEPVVGLMTEWLKGNMLEKRKERQEIWAVPCGLVPIRPGLEPGSKIAEVYKNHRDFRAAPASI